MYRFVKITQKLCRQAMLLLPALLLLSGCLSAPPPDIRVIDGDTFVADGVKYRLWAIDAPEKGQSYGREATAELAAILAGAALSFERHGTSWDRQVVRVEADGRDVGLLLLERGAAWYCPEYGKRAEYEAAAQEAMAARRGLWQEEEPVNPKDFRNVH